MPLQMIVNELMSGEKHRSFELKLILQIAALLKNKKESGLIMLSEWELREVKEKLSKKGIRHIVLYSEGLRYLTLLFRSERLKKLLMDEQTKAYLKTCGYERYSLGAMLKNLSSRCRQFSKSRNFPHEIGLFLGYPLCDVEGFTRNNGESYLYSGYWKIYDNPEETLSKFKSFDDAKNEAIREWFSGKSIAEIAA